MMRKRKTIFCRNIAGKKGPSAPRVVIFKKKTQVAIAHLEEALAELHIAAGCPSAATG